MLHSSTSSSSLIWVPPEENSAWLQKIALEFNIHPVIAQVLISRGFTSLEEIRSYLYAKLPDLHDPYTLTGMEKAVIRIMKAIRQNEGILVYGDNDVDGITGTALLAEFLKQVGARVMFYVPHHTRLRQSMMIDAQNCALKYKLGLIITVDHGITAAEEIEHLLKAKIDVIITDHHEPTDKLPNTVATLNPKLFNSKYPNRDLTGVGVAFKLAHALTIRMAQQGQLTGKKIDLKDYLDLVALGTIADMGSLRGENRILVKYGLEELRKGKRVGLVKLIEQCGISLNEVASTNLVAKVIPQLNSLGRIANARKGIELLLMKNSRAAELLAHEIEVTNKERQKIEKAISHDVDQMFRENPELLKDKAIVLSSDQWHPGVIAIVVTRIMRHYNRPTVMIAVENGIGKGSIRTIHEFPLLSILKQNRELFYNFGGHDFAAGLTIKEKNIEQFKQKFIEAANSQLGDQDIKPKLHLDASIDFKDITFEFMDSLSLLEPFGNDNAPPVFYSTATQMWPPKIISKEHLRLYLENSNRFLEGIAFGMSDRFLSLKNRHQPIDVAFTPHVNNYQNKLSIQLLIRDFKFSESSISSESKKSQHIKLSS